MEKLTFIGEVFIYILITMIIIVTILNLSKYFKRKTDVDFKDSFEDLLEHNRKAIKSESERY